MAQSLSPELLAAQTSDFRQPIIKAQFGEWTNTIPLKGQFLDNKSNIETSPYIMCHSSGAIFLPFVDTFTDPASYTLMLAYTDINRTLWSQVALTPNSRTKIYCPVPIQIPNSQNVSIYYLTSDSIGVKFNQVIVNAAGNVVSGPTVLTGYLSAPITSLSIVWTGSEYFAAYVQKGILYSMTSDNGTIWTDGVVVTLSGISGQIENCSVCYVGGDLLVWFDVNDVYKVWNLYYVVSLDGGTFSAPTKVTTFSTPATIGKRPFLFAKSVNEIIAAYNEIRSSLHMDPTNPAWPSSLKANAGNLHFDKVNRQLYVICDNTFVGLPKFFGILRIAVDSWAISGFWRVQRQYLGFQPCIVQVTVFLKRWELCKATKTMLLFFQPGIISFAYLSSTVWLIR